MRDSRIEIEKNLPEAYPKLWRYCVVLSKDKDWAKDLAQMACIRALANHRQFKPGTSLQAWLFRIARNCWLNELKARSVRLGQGTLNVEDADLRANDISQETNIFHDQVLSKCMELPEKLRETLFLVYVQGFTYAEAAEHLDIPQGTVMSRLAAARQKLKVSLGGKADDK